jgi:ATP-dependent RNA helicase DDX24/MAK5
MKAPKSSSSKLSRASALPKRGILKKTAGKRKGGDADLSTSATKSASTDIKREKKRLKTDSLAWKPVNTSNIVGIDDGGGMMMLEELEDVGVEWEEGETGTKVAHFVVCPLCPTE